MIDKDELLRNMEADIDISITGVRNMEVVKCCLQTLLDDVRNSPEVEAVRHGRWEFVRMEEDGNGFYVCSNCHHGDTHVPELNVPYCWFCGARMDEDETY